MFELRAQGAHVIAQLAQTPLAVNVRRGLAPVAVVLLLVVGEVAAIYTPANGEPTASARRAIETAFFGGGIIVAFGLVDVVARPLTRDATRIVEVVRSVLFVVAIAAWLAFNPGSGTEGSPGPYVVN
jgi:hypothetical protein